MKIFLKISRITIVVLIAISTVILTTGLASAQYGGGSYGGSGGGENNQCTYGQTCPIEVQPNNPEPEPDPEPEPTPEDPNLVPEIIDQNNNNGSGTTTTDSPTKASEKVKVRGIQGIVLKQTVDIVERIPEAHRVTAPYYSWFLLLIFSVILIVIAIIDRNKSVKLINAVKELQQVLQEQKNFLRLAMHNLNTPLATTKGVADLLSTKKTEEDATKKLESVAQNMESTISLTTSSIANESVINSTVTKSNINITFFKIFGQWYFFVPVIVAILFALIINSALSYTDTNKPSNYLFIQIAVAVMITLIFANSIRLLRISKNQKRVYNQVTSLINELKLQRTTLINNLKNALENIVTALESSLDLIQDKKIASMLTNSISALKSLMSKIDMATRADVSSPSKINIGNSIRKIIEDNSSDITAKGLKVTDNLDSIGEINLNPKEFDIAIKSIIDNAIEYNTQGGSIDINIAKPSANKVTVKVTDGGEGIKQETLGSLFQPFSKTSDVLQYDHDGMGMSLYASKSALDRINGQIHIDSKIGKGTTATNELPAYP